MLTKEDLTYIYKLPSITDISLQMLQEFYKDYLCSNSYLYELNDGHKIILNFYPENFCHLLGLHHVVPSHLKKNYKGFKGYQRIQDGTITFKHLQGISEFQFKSIKNKLRYFPYIYQLVQNPQIIKYDWSKVGVKDSKIRCELLLYDIYNNANIHLGIEEKNEAVGYYIARTFLIEKNEGDKFIRGQSLLNVKRIDVSPKVNKETMEQTASGIL